MSYVRRNSAGAPFFVLGRCALYDDFDPRTGRAGALIGKTSAVILELTERRTDYGADADGMPADVDALDRRRAEHALLRGLFEGEALRLPPGGDVWAVTEWPAAHRLAVRLSSPVREDAVYVRSARRLRFALRARVRLDDPYEPACEVWIERDDGEGEA